MENLRGAFRLRKGGRVEDRHLVLIDDVMTTGSTVDECARMLTRAGAASVRVLTVARA
jgi:predicted amidophosphoribosyltransferase